MTTTIQIASPEDLLGYVPYALGYHPADSLIVMAVGRDCIDFTARADIGSPTREIVRRLQRAIRYKGDDHRIVLAGYGGAQAREATEAAATVIATLGYQVSAALWVTGNRYFCVLCTDCTPAEGTAFDLRSSAAAATAVAAGLVARGTRDEAVKQIRPVGGLAAVAMTQAVDQAEVRLGQIRSSTAMVRQGKLAVDEAMSLGERGEKLGVDEVAWLSLLLTDLQVRDHAWMRTDAEDWQFSLWLDLSRRAEPILAAPIATLLGWCCYRRGDGLLAGESLRRALRIDPGYTLAGLLLTALDEAQPPSSFSPWPPRE